MAAKENTKTSAEDLSHQAGAVPGEGAEAGKAAEPFGCKKTTVAFHAAEQDRVDEILDSLFRSRRHRGGFSDAVKVALRLCPLDDAAIAAAWDEARAQDGRTLRHRKNS